MTLVPIKTTAILLLGALTGFGQVSGYASRNSDVFTLPRGSSPSSINNTGAILASGNGSGFLVKNGELTPIRPPVADVGFVYPNGMNDAGDIVGEYRDAGNNGPFAFAIVSGVFLSLSEPGGRRLFPQDINHRRVIVGGADRPGERQVGFILRDGQFTFVQCPGINEATMFTAINRDGTIGGYCFGGPTRGFIYRNGTFTFVHYPGSTGTRVSDINANGDLAGDAEVPDPLRGPKRVAFLYRNGVFHDVSFPGSRQSLARSIKEAGSI